MMDVLLLMKTFSMAIEGTSARRTRRRALAMAASTPTMSNSSSSSDRRTKEIRNFCMVGEGGRREEGRGERGGER